MPNLSYRKPLLPDLGAVFGLVWAANEKATQNMSDIAEDLRAFHAPSECGDIAYRNVDKPIREAIEFAEATTGMKWEAILEEVKARTGGRWLAWYRYQSLVPGTLEEEC